MILRIIFRKIDGRDSLDIIHRIINPTNIRQKSAITIEDYWKANDFILLETEIILNKVLAKSEICNTFNGIFKGVSILPDIKYVAFVYSIPLQCISENDDIIFLEMLLNDSEIDSC